MIIRQLHHKDNEFHIISLAKRVKDEPIAFRDIDLTIKECIIFGAFDSELVGMATLSYMQSLRGMIGYIGDVAVDEFREGEGIGRALVDACVNRAIEDGSYKVILTCSADLSAFYEKAGFEEAGSYMRKAL